MLLFQGTLVHLSADSLRSSDSMTLWHFKAPPQSILLSPSILDLVKDMKALHRKHLGGAYVRAKAEGVRARHAEQPTTHREQPHQPHQPP